MLEKSNAIPALVGSASIWGTLTFSDVYQGMSFLVLLLTAVHLIVKIKKEHNDTHSGD